MQLKNLLTAAFALSAFFTFFAFFKDIGLAASLIQKKENPKEEFRRYYQAGFALSYGITENFRLFAETE